LGVSTIGSLFGLEGQGRGWVAGSLAEGSVVDDTRRELLDVAPRRHPVVGRLGDHRPA
jgi:hypothetical protein